MGKALPLFVGLLLAAPAAHACSCMGNNSYCETLSSEWSLPDATALVVKLSDVHYGITVRVLQTLDGSQLPDDTLTVWGDNGALCRIYLNGMAIGDTMVFGLNETDFMGNSVWNPEYPHDLEQEGDYVVSVCGVHALDYDNGLVTGWITGPVTESMTLAEFMQVVATCSLTSGVPDPDADNALQVAGNGGDRPVLSLAAQRQVQLQVLDALGRSIIARNWDGSPLPLHGLAPATYVVQLRIEDRTIGRRVTVGR